MPVQDATITETAEYNGKPDHWYDDTPISEEEDDGYSISEYDIVSAPNDFNVSTIFNLIESGVIKIPKFQRNYVWDIKRASRLIESLIIGLPIPQVFLYEQSRNNFLVIDGQQRLMTIYYFVKGRFPRTERRVEIRHFLKEKGSIPDHILADDHYFQPFKLKLTESIPDKKNKFHTLVYDTLGEYQSTFDLRTIRCIIVKQVAPDGDAAIYEIFNRLNIGGVNLYPQEIRMSLYHSDFYDMLSRANMNPVWRAILGIAEADLHMKDLEFLLRGFALLTFRNQYRRSMSQFLNEFSKHAKTFSSEEVQYFDHLFDSFLKSCSRLNSAHFQRNNRFSFMLFEAVFVATCQEAYDSQDLVTGTIQPETVETLAQDKQFFAAAQQGTASKENVFTRMKRAQEHIRLG